MKHQALIAIAGVLAVGSALVETPAQASLFTPPPSSGTVKEATGGASRGSLFAPKKSNGTVNEATGGASRGMFAPKQGTGTVTEATGGASRGMFAPKQGTGTVTEATGGASRGTMFVPAPDRRILRETTAGASRGSLFAPRKGDGTVNEATGGASRGLFARRRGQGVIKESTGGGSRVGSYDINPAVVGTEGPAAMLALLPQTYSGTTIADRPTLYVYLPASAAQTMVFSLQDEGGNVQYQTSLPVSSGAGIRQITLPADAPALKLGQNYQWFLALKIDDELSPRTPYVDGWIQRIAATPEMTAALNSNDGMKRAEVLGKNGIWYDYATEVARLQTSSPAHQSANQAQSPAQKEWQELLEGIDLKAIQSAPVMAPINTPIK